MQKQHLEFVVTNDPDLDFDLMREAWLNNEVVADVRNVDNIWKISFFPTNERYCELTWDVLEKIRSAFSEFIKEQDALKTVKSV